jgi:hypothetical protein
MTRSVKRAILAAVVVAVLAVAAAVWLVAGHNGPVSSVADLQQGDCVDGSSSAPHDLSRVDCDSDHDAEVLAAFDLSATEATAYRDAVPNEVCAAHLDTARTTAVNDMTLLLAGVIDGSSARSGDPVACLAFKADGSRLDGHVGTR